jgi:hypothetical protein
MAAAITVSDFEFVLATLLRQGNDTPLRKALLREAVTDMETIMCTSDSDIEGFKFPDDSSGTIVLRAQRVGLWTLPALSLLHRLC